jgi:hypothetical protein
LIPTLHSSIQNAGKQQGMRKAKVIQPFSLTNSVLQPAAYPKFGTEVVRKLKESMESVECPPKQKLTWKQFGQLIGAPKSTVHDWNYDNLAAPIKHFLSGIKRPSELQRLKFFHVVCREWPTNLSDPWTSAQPSKLLRDNFSRINSCELPHDNLGKPHNKQ